MGRNQKVFIAVFSLLFAVGSVVPAGAVVGRQSLRETRPDRTVIRNVSIVRDNLGDIMQERYVQDEILVKFRNEEKFRRVTLRGETPEEVIERFRGRADIEYAEPNYLAYALFVPNDTYYSPYQWNLDNPIYGGINVESAWDTSIGTGVTVAVIDTGVLQSLSDFGNTTFVQGYDFANNDSNPADDEGHGSHVAGTIAQSTNNGRGVAGIAYGASIMPVKVLDRRGSGTYADIADGIRFAADNGADIINLSLGGSSPSATMENAVAYAYGKGVTIVAAAGNNGSSGALYPAAYNDYVIAVGATRYDETLTSYSNYGSDIDVVAPGGDLSVDQNGDGYGDGILQQTFSRWTWNTGYYFYQGTSMASPHVAGVAALIIANGNASTPDGVRSIIESTADDLGAADRDNTYGWGLVNAAAALGGSSTEPPPPENSPPVANAGPDKSGEIGELINFDGSGSTDDGTIVSYEWDFGDGTTDTGTLTSHTYDTANTYTVTLTVTDDGGLTDSDTAVSTISEIAEPPPPENQPPVADAGPDQAAETGQTVSFDGSGSTDDGTIVSYEWDFGDGATSTGISVEHTYSTADTYTVTLTVTDDGSLTDSDTAAVTVNEVAPPPPSGEIEVFADSFEVSEWNGLWTEDSQNDWFRSRQRATDGRRSAEVDGRASDAALTSIQIDLQGKTSVTISFSWYIERRLDSGEYLAFDISTDGGSTWVENARLRGNQDQENIWHNESFALSSINNLQIRFRGTMSKRSEDANVDDVRVVAE